jgi:hypothetical protein
MRAISLKEIKAIKPQRNILIQRKDTSPNRRGNKEDKKLFDISFRNMRPGWKETTLICP